MLLNRSDLQYVEERIRPLAAAPAQAARDALVRLPDNVPEDVLRAWAESGRTLAEREPSIASAYFQASPEVIGGLSAEQIAEWAQMGRRLHGSNFRTTGLAARFFALSPSILQRVSFAELERFGRFIEALSRLSIDATTASLESAPRTFEILNEDERGALISFAGIVAEESRREVGPLFELSADLLSVLDPFQRITYLSLMNRAGRRLGKQAFAAFVDGCLALKQLPVANHARLISLADRLLPLSVWAATAFIKNSPKLAERLDIEEIELWHTQGIEIFYDSGVSAEAFFKLESNRAEEAIQNLTSRVDLSYVSDLLRLYGKALTGANVSVHPVGALAEKGIGWVSEGGASTEGRAIFLPEFIDEFSERQDNFGVFKVYTTHQAGHLEFGSFGFDYKRDGTVFPRRRGEIEAQRREQGLIEREQWLTDMERFFDLFEDRQLASDLFATVEDLRIDSRIRESYGGMRGVSRRLQQIELGRRPNTYFLPLRQAFVENLVRATLDGRSDAGWPRELAQLMHRALGVLTKMRAPEATVEDSAEATLLLYELAEQVPNLDAGDVAMDWMSIEEVEEEGMTLRRSPSDAFMLEGTKEVPYESPNQVDFRGDFKPELVQLLERMRDEATGAAGEDDERSPLTLERIQEMLEKSAEIDDLDPSDLAELQQMLDNLQTEAEREEVQAPSTEGQEPQSNEPPPPLLRVRQKATYHDEWDFRAGDYRPRWCAVYERILAEGSGDFYDKTLKANASLVRETQKQFELLKPETFRKLKRLEDGEDIDLDAAIEFMVQKRSGHGENPKVYWRRNKAEREVAVAFLLDMSGSTDETIERKPVLDPKDPDYASKYYHWVNEARLKTVEDRRKKIIDLEKESLVLLTQAIEVIGDKYGIYGFSGDTRENVEYYVIKDFLEYFDDDVKRRFDSIAPNKSTRMGAAIRHTIPKLMAVAARARILFMISDGRPQDTGYGLDANDKEYAIRDTHKAFQEAKSKGITPFAITVDKEGHDYLRQMCGDMAYEVLDNIELLPSRLPSVYRMLTE